MYRDEGLKNILWNNDLITHTMQEMHVNELRIGVKMHSARNLCGEWWLKAAKLFHMLILSASSTTATPNFRTYILILNLLISVPSTCLYICAKYFWNTLYVQENIYLFCTYSVHLICSHCAYHIRCVKNK